ncbi:MAG: hypothetical protein ACFWUL_10525 [Dialister sp.]
MRWVGCRIAADELSWPIEVSHWNPPSVRTGAPSHNIRAFGPIPLDLGLDLDPSTFPIPPKIHLSFSSLQCYNKSHNYRKSDAGQTVFF